MWNKILRVFVYLISRAAVVAIVVGLVIGVYYSSVKTSNLYFVIQDALKARLDIILSDASVEEKSKFFTYNYLNSAEYAELQKKYENYEITGFHHKHEFEIINLIVMPWKNEKTVIVRETVQTIVGNVDEAKISKEEAREQGIDKIPQWQDSEYEVTLVYENESWCIDSIKRAGDFDYQPPATPSLSKEEIDALRTPVPDPTPTFNPNVDLTGEHPAKISTPLRGDKVNVRLGPATEYKVLEELDNGASITVLDESDGWYLVRTAKGTEGYVSGYYILFE